MASLGALILMVRGNAVHEMSFSAASAAGGFFNALKNCGRGGGSVSFDASIVVDTQSLHTLRCASVRSSTNPGGSNLVVGIVRPQVLVVTRASSRSWSSGASNGMLLTGVVS